MKELLCQSDQKSDYSDIVDNTSGVIFYSTPHRGSALANISSKGSRIFSPTVEVQELSQGKTPQYGEYIHYMRYYSALILKDSKICVLS